MAVPGETDPETGTSIRRGSAFLLLAQISSNLGYFVAVLVLARGLSVGERGTVAFITTASTVLERVGLLGVDQATIVLAARRPAERRHLLTNLYAFTIVATTILGALVVAVVWLLGAHPVDVTHAELVVLAAGGLVGALSDAGYAFLLGVGRPGDWTKIATVAPWVYAAALVGLAASGVLDVYRAVLVWTLAHLLWAVGAAVLCVRRARPGGLRLGLLRETLGLGIRAWVGALSRFLNFRVDQIILGLLASNAVLGVYAIAVNLSEVTLYLPGAVATASIAAIARVSADRRATETLRTFRLLALITAAVVLGAAVVGAPLLPLVFGRPYVASVVPYLWLLPGALGYAASSVFSSALLGSPRPLLSSVGPFVSLVSGVALDFALIPVWGASGAAAAATAAFVAGGTTAVAAFRRTHDFALRELVPGRDDVATATGLGRRLLARLRRSPAVRPDV